MQVITSSCGCFTDKRNKVQGKCHGHRGNPTAAGFTRIDIIDVTDMDSDVAAMPVAA